jgi:hypothetical protein
MSFVEFLEALARLAEKLSPQPIGSEKVNNDINYKSKNHMN